MSIIQLGLFAGEQSFAERHFASASFVDERRHSDGDTRLRLGLRQIDGFSEEWGKTIESTRGRGFNSVRELWLRTGLPPKALQKLAHADAFNSLGLNRRDALWAVKALQRAGDKDNLPLFARVGMPALEPDAHLPSMLAGRAGDRGLSPSASRR